MNWQQECKKWHDLGLEALDRFGLAPFMLRIYPIQSDNCVVWMEPDGLSDKSRAKLRAINATMRQQNPAAVLFACDTWMARSDKWCERFGIPRNLPMEQFSERYLKILRDEFSGRLANAPESLRSEALFTVLKGPQISQPITFFTFYHRDHRDSNRVVVEKTVTQDEFPGMINLIPDWWEVTVH